MLKLEKARRELSKWEDLFTSNNYRFILAEIFIYLISPNSFFQGYFKLLLYKEKILKDTMSL